MDIGTRAYPKRSIRKRKKIYVCGHGLRTVKSRRTQWVEEDMTMDILDITNTCTEEEVGQDYSTWDGIC